METKHKAKIIFDNILVKDDKYHWPDSEIGWIDAFPIDGIIFGIVNATDQIVSVQPIGRAGAVMGDLGSVTLVPANSETVVPLNLRNYWSPYLSVSVRATGIPSAGGRITVYAIVRDK